MEEWLFFKILTQVEYTNDFLKNEYDIWYCFFQVENVENENVESAM